jgi:hypothetical protein
VQMLPLFQMQFKYILNYKKNWIKMLHVHLHNLYMRQVVSRKSDSSLGLVKKDKFWW